MDARECGRDGLKTCTKCGETKTSDQFYKRNKSKDGLRSECKTCNSGAFREWRRANPEKHTERVRRWYEANPEKGKERLRRWAKANPEKKTEHRQRAKLKKYNITTDEYNQLLEKQGHRCACCGKHQLELKIKLAVDHCHVSGKIRGLLCFDCNSAIGKLGDNYAGVHRALEYLLKFE